MKKERLIEVSIIRFNGKGVVIPRVILKFLPSQGGEEMCMCYDLTPSSFSLQKRLGSKTIRRIVKLSANLKYLNESLTTVGVFEKMSDSSLYSIEKGTVIGTTTMSAGEIDMLKETIPTILKQLALYSYSKNGISFSDIDILRDLLKIWS